MTFFSPCQFTRLGLFAISVCIAQPLIAQPGAVPSSRALESDSTPQRVTHALVEAGGLFSSSGITPYWLQTNQYGIVPKSAPTALLIAGVQADYRGGNGPYRRRADWGYGLEVVGQGGSTNRVILAEGYLKARLGVFELSAGRRRQREGLAESPLSSGSFIWSGNALPLPQVELSIPDYAPLGFTRGLVAVRGSFAHGWFGRSTYVSNSFLHRKAIYVRLGKPQSRVRLHGAFTHYSQWAGYAPFLESDPTSSFSGQIANSVDAYVNVVVPVKTNRLKNLAKFTTYDQNRVGDHRGSADMAVEIRLNHGSIFAYQQHFYDIGRKLYNLRNIEDGLYGVRFQDTRPNRLFQDVVIELFNSGSQGVFQFGKVLGGEAENYFLNGQYPEGWSYRGRTIGTPFMSQSADVDPALPRISFGGPTLAGELIEGVYGINNNRVWALHTGLSGNFGREWGYTAKASYSRNYGTTTIFFPANTNQLSTLVSITKAMNWLAGSTLLVSVGYDEGKLLVSPSQVGGYVGLRKTWSGRSRIPRT